MPQLKDNLQFEQKFKILIPMAPQNFLLPQITNNYNQFHMATP